MTAIQSSSSVSFDSQKAKATTEKVWDDSIVPALTEYIRIPNKSPLFDADWKAHGHMDRAVDLIASWCKERLPEDATLEVIGEGDRTPVIFMEIPGTSDETVLLYGHLDKQPEMVGWSEDLGPWKPVLKDDKLYGRGGADDGYSAFASVTAINLLREQGTPHARCVVLIEACEESGSYDLPFYIDLLKDRIGSPALVVCLDSGCGNYDQLWCTTSLRGVITGNLVVELISEGVHSGDASGVVPGSFRVLRKLLDRLEDPDTGVVHPDFFQADIPAVRTEQAKKVADVLDAEIWTQFPFHEGVKPAADDLAELVLNRTWRPALTVTGSEGLPAIQDAGNVMRPMSAVKLSLRLPPTVDGPAVANKLQALLEEDPPYGARVRFEEAKGATGWNAPEVSPWLNESLSRASETFFGKEAMHMGEGGSIPFIGMLGEKFPKAQFLITGVLGPQSNAHGPNEFLHIPTGKRLTCCVAQVLADHFAAANS